MPIAVKLIVNLLLSMMVGRVHLDGRRIDVVETLDRWYGRDYCYIKVKSRDESVYILRLDETHTEWELTMFQRAQDGGPRPSA